MHTSTSTSTRTSTSTKLAHTERGAPTGFDCIFRAVPASQPIQRRNHPDCLFVFHTCACMFFVQYCLVFFFLPYLFKYQMYMLTHSILLVVKSDEIQMSFPAWFWIRSGYLIVMRVTRRKGCYIQLRPAFCLTTQRLFKGRRTPRPSS